jgi:hypothetical protein
MTRRMEGGHVEARETRSPHIMPPHHASFGQVVGAVGAMCAAGGVTYYAINVAKIFGGARARFRRRERG